MLRRVRHDANEDQIFAVVVGALSAVSCVAYFIPFVLRLGGIVIPAWNCVLFILWTAVFGIFAKVITTPLRERNEIRVG